MKKNGGCNFITSDQSHTFPFELRIRLRTLSNFDPVNPNPSHNSAKMSFPKLAIISRIVVVVYHVTILAFGHGLLKKFWPFGSRLRSTYCREFLEYFE